MTSLRATWFRLKRRRLHFAILLQNFLVLLVTVNLALAVVFVVNDRLAAAPPRSAPGLERLSPAQVAALYPGWRDVDIARLRHESLSPLEYAPFTQFKEQPASGVFVSVSAHGYRPLREQAAWPPDPEARSVFVFGGSTVFGVNVADSDTIPSHLQEALRSKAPAPPAVAVYNFGRAGYYSTQERILFEQLLEAGTVPDAAVFVGGLNDFYHTTDTTLPMFTAAIRRLWSAATRGVPTVEAFRAIPIMRAARSIRSRLDRVFGIVRPGSRPGWLDVQAEVATRDSRDAATPAAVIEATIERLHRNRRMLRALCRAFEIECLFVLQPVPAYRYELRHHLFVKDLADLGRNVNSGAGYELLSRSSETASTDVLWLADMQQDRRECLYVDTVHYSPAFNREIAERIAEALSKRQAAIGSSKSAAVGAPTP